MDPSLQDRFDELDAARALGDLSVEEQKEWERLLQEGDFRPDPDLDWLVAGLEETYSSDDSQLSPELQKKLEADAGRFAAAEVESEIVSPWSHPAIGWAVAACLVFGFFLFEKSENSVLIPALAREALLLEVDVLQREFEGAGNYVGMSGDVVWSDGKQEGYMLLNGLAVNDPEVQQYQLWIVDPERDSVPVDGGVFDVSEESRAIVPIHARLNVEQPVAFVITVEKPGGVVVSKQEEVAAIAQE